MEPPNIGMSLHYDKMPFIARSMHCWMDQDVNSDFVSLQCVCAGMRCVALVLKVLLSLLACEMSAAQLSCPEVCTCVAGVVDCSKRGLTTASLPTSFPAHTTQLHLNDNHLTALPNGLLDSLPSLRLAALHDNPWSCDCGILYLRGWLLKRSNHASLQWVCGLNIKNVIFLKAKPLFFHALVDFEILNYLLLY